jgi:hypothetical protein
MYVMVPDPSGCLSRTWTVKGEERGYVVIFREETRDWLIKFPVAPESTRAVETTPDGQTASEIVTRKGLFEKDNGGILTPTLGDR